MTVSERVELFFRHEYGDLVASLTRRTGVHHLAAVEDAAKAAVAAALESWTGGRVPDNPSVWLYRVARNHLTGELRKEARRQLLLEEGEVAPFSSRSRTPIRRARCATTCCGRSSSAATRRCPWSRSWCSH